MSTIKFVEHMERSRSLTAEVRERIGDMEHSWVIEIHDHVHTERDKRSGPIIVHRGEITPTNWPRVKVVIDALVAEWERRHGKEEP
jgi:hypothetical protein